MGTFTYDGTVTVNFDDRLLLHLQSVISGRLRRDEAFMFSWSKPDSIGGRTSVWIDPHIPVMFDYTTSDMPHMNRQWLDDLTETTYRPSGLQIVPEPGPRGRVTPNAKTPRPVASK